MFKAAVIGAGYIGSTTAMRLAQFNLFDEVILTDVVDGKAQGLALDISQSRPIEGFDTRVRGTTTGADGSGYDDIAGCDVVVLTAGVPRKPGMSRADLIGVNADIVRGVSTNIAAQAPAAVVIVVSNPLDEMTALAQQVTGFEHQRVMGQAGVLDSARFAHFVAEKLGVPVSTVATLTLGSHGDTMVPVPSHCTVGGRALTDVLSASEIDDLVARTRAGGAEIVGLLKTGSAYFAPSAAAARMAKAVVEDSGAVVPVCAWMDGEYGISEVYLGVEAEIGRHGVRRVVESPLTTVELAALREAATAVGWVNPDSVGSVPV
jgi:malate dehydrogenase